MSSTSVPGADELDVSRRFHRLGTRLILSTLIVLVLGHVLSSLHTIWTERRSLAEQIDARGQSLSEVASVACLEPLLGSDYPQLQTFLQGLTSDLARDVTFARIERPDGNVVSQSLQKPQPGAGTSVKRFQAEIRAPGEPGEVIGRIILGMSTASLDELGARRSRELLIFSSATFVVLGLLLSYFLRSSVVRPIARLDEHAAALGRGELDRPIVLETRDEFSRLASTLDEMRRSLRTSYNQLRERNEELQRVGAVRDRALPDLEAALVRANEASRAKTEFLGTMSHEIRTPLNGVIGHAGLLFETALDEEQREYARAVRESAESLRLIVDDILDFTQLDAGRIALQLADFDLRVVLQEASAAARAEAEKKGLELRSYVDSDVPDRVRSDPLRLKQVLAHLLSNAVKFTATGSVTLKIALDGSEDGRCLIRFAVIDTGIGLAPEARASLFAPFSQLDSSSTRSHGGTGLGLAICAHLVRLLGGKLGVESEQGSGSLFWFTAWVEPVVCPARGDADAAEARRPSSASLVLVVEDNPVNQRMALHMLRKGGYGADLAENGEVALEKLSKTDYALVLMDCSMPVMDGFEATRRIRELEAQRGGHVPIVALTANAMPGDRERCLEAGMDGYLAKPVTTEQLVAKIGAFARRAG
jgi:signal transduction histidine kinase/ActR/RegA family two-component response regulator